MSLFDSYQTDGFYDEMFQPDGQPRPHYRKLYQRLCAMTVEDYRRRCQLAELTLIQQGITFAVYGDGQARSPSVHELMRSSSLTRCSVMSVKHPNTTNGRTLPPSTPEATKLLVSQ